MEGFYLNPKVIHQILVDKKVEYLYHANTVLTSLTFIKQKCLLSRAFVAKENLIQTDQKSDAEDKKFDVWDDVFLDGLDLHKKYRQANFYGPVLFVMKLDLLLSPSLPPLFVTKNNPMYWRDDEEIANRYHTSEQTVKENYLTGKLDSRIMFTFKSPGTFIKLNKYLKGIVIDKPHIIVPLKSGGQGNIGDRTFQIIKTELDQNGLGHIPMKFRHQGEGLHYCGCYLDYNVMRWTEFHKRFRNDEPSVPFD